jgi:hypothetical protein
MATREELLNSNYMLTTFDNPFDPFTQWDEWYRWDMQAGYHTPGLLDRVARVSDDLADIDVHLAIQTAIQEIVEYNVSGMHRKVQRGDLPIPADQLAKAGQKEDEPEN